MKQFIVKLIRVLIIPMLLLVGVLIFWDPFKVFITYDDYYTNNAITGNREDVCLKLFEKNENKTQIRNFIIGSSRSQAFKTSNWSTYLNNANAKIFHYDGSGMGLYRAANAIQYLSLSTGKIDNLLLIVDTDFFKEIENPDGHLFAQPSKVSQKSHIKYYSLFLKASIDIQFLFCNLFYKLSGDKYYDFMGYHISKSIHNHISDNQTGDIWYSYDHDIKNDSNAYYLNLMKHGVFYARPQMETVSIQLIHNKQLELLKQIKKSMIKNDANIKIVISPLYSQLKFNKHDLVIIESMFGKSNVYDFSGKNEITDDYRNYYENAHYKPYVANQIMDRVYSTVNP